MSEPELVKEVYAKALKEAGIPMDDSYVATLVDVTHRHVPGRGYVRVVSDKELSDVMALSIACNADLVRRDKEFKFEITCFSVVFSIIVAMCTLGVIYL